MVLLAAPDFEFGRYADTLVNVVLAVRDWETSMIINVLWQLEACLVKSILFSTI